MKKFAIFMSGVATGIAIFIAITLIIMASSTRSPQEKENNKKDDGITMFSELGDCISTGRFEVSEVLESGHAIIVEQEHVYGDKYLSTGIKALILCDEGKSYYDGQIIKAPAGKCFRQSGVFRNIFDETLPILEISDKK